MEGKKENPRRRITFHTLLPKLLFSLQIPTFVFPGGGGDSPFGNGPDFDYPFSELIIWAVLTKRKEMAKLMWQHGKLHLKFYHFRLSYM